MPNSSPATILIVDDTPTNLEVLSSALAVANYRVAIAIDGESAIEQVEYRLPDLILLDVMMPGIDGFETCRRLKANPLTRDVPVIFMTALTDTTDRVKGLSLGAVDYIAKPFQQEEVLARVRVHLDLYQLQRSLADQVRERTADLSQALADLKAAQVRSIQAEKMSALGQLVAGVAHEINNPVNFIYGNLFHARDYISNLIQVLEAYDRYFPDRPASLRQLEDSVDLEFLCGDLPRLLESMQLGSERIRDIVKSLRNFSRLDEAERKPVDLHEGIESTLVILSNRLKPQGGRMAIDIIKKYGQLPRVECFASQINQIFVNLLANAIDALDAWVEHATTDWQPTIWITTQVERGQVGETDDDCDWVQVRVVSNGGSISEQVREKIFDPFFTTKPVGQGTGLGLSISYQIATEGHGGQLLCLPREDERAEFLLRLPVTPPAFLHHGHGES